MFKVIVVIMMTGDAILRVVPGAVEADYGHFLEDPRR